MALVLAVQGCDGWVLVVVAPGIRCGPRASDDPSVFPTVVPSVVRYVGFVSSSVSGFRQKFPSVRSVSSSVCKFR